MGTLNSEPFIDTRNSCTADFAVALMLGRRAFDGYYPDYKASEASKNPRNPNGDVVAHEYFLEFLDTSIFEILAEERDTVEMEKEDAIDAKAEIAKDGKRNKEQRIEGLQRTIDACNVKLVESANTEVLARKYLRAIADELANKVNPLLREDTTATQKHGGVVHITLASLERWIDKAYPKEFRSALKQGLAPPVAAAPVVEVPYDPKDDQLDEKGRMNKRGRDSLYLTVGVLIDLYFNLAKEALILVDSLPKKPVQIVDNVHVEPHPHTKSAGAIVGKKGSLVNLQLAFLIEKAAKKCADKKIVVSGQASERLLNRIEEALQTKTRKLGHITPIDRAPEIT